MPARFRSFLFLCLALALCLGVPQRAAADTATWTGATDSSWATGSNWSTGSAPSAADDAFIDTGTGTVISLAGATATTLTVGQSSAGLLTIDENGTLSTTALTIGDLAGSTGTVTVSGSSATLAVTATATLGNAGSGSLAVLEGGASTINDLVMGCATGTSSSLAIDGSGSSLDMTTGSDGLLMIMGSGGDSTLTVSNGASMLISQMVSLGDGQNITLRMTGSGSSFTSSGQLYFDGNSTNLLVSVEDGATLEVGSLLTYSDNDAVSIVVTGTGSRLIDDSNLDVATASGVFNLTVANGALLENSSLLYAGADNETITFLVTGTGSTWNNVSDGRILVLGNGSDVSMTVSNGGTITNNGFYAEGTGENVAILVTGTGSAWNNSGQLNAEGDFNNVSLTISNGASVTTDGVFGSGTSENVAIVVTGTGTRWTNSGEKMYGDSSTVSLTIADGAQVTDGGFFGGATDQTIALVVTGTGSLWSVNDQINISGDSSTFSLKVADGASLSNDGFYVEIEKQNVTVLVTGVNTTWTNSGQFHLDGDSSNFSVRASDGATISNTSLFAETASGTATIVVTGKGTTWINSSDVFLDGQNSLSSFTLADGATFTDNSFFARGNGEKATILATGSGTTWINNSYIFFYGLSSDVSMTIADRAQLQSQWTYVTAANQIANILVSGAGTTWTNSKEMYLGNGANSTAALTISDGATVESGTITAGASGSDAVIEVTGAGSILRDTGSLILGTSTGTGTLILANGGSASVASDLVLGDGGTGTLVIGAPEGSTAVAPGTLEAATLSFASTGTGFLIFNHTSTAYSFATALSGNGSLLFENGKTILTGDDSLFTGQSTVASGATLAVNTTLGGTVSVLSGGRLQGNGTLSEATLARGSTIAPGNSIGTLSVTGALTMNGATYEAEITPSGSSDKIVVSGLTTLTGGALVLIPYTDGTYRVGTTYTLLTSEGGITGSFDSASLAGGFLFLTASLTQTTNSIAATLVRNDTTFADVAANANQAATAGGIESLGNGNALYDTIASSKNATAVREAYQTLDGEIHPDIKGEILESDDRFAGILAGRLDQANEALTTQSLNRMTTRPLQMNSVGYLYGRHLKPQTKAKKQPVHSGEPTAWMQIFGEWGTRASDGNANKFTHQSQGVAIGADTKLQKWRVGMAFAYEQGTGDVEQSVEASGDVKAYRLALYGGRSFGRTGIKGGLIGGWNSVTTNRTTSLVQADWLTASYGAASVRAFGEASYRLPLSAVTLEPFGRASWGYLHVESFDEKGGETALALHTSDDQQTTTLLGLRLQKELPLQKRQGATEREQAIFRAQLGWRHRIGASVLSDKMSLEGSEAFKIRGAPLARDAAVAAMSIDLALTPNATAGFGYSGAFAPTGLDQSVRGNVQYRF